MTSPNAPLPLLALVGRPNVGKSTLFNKVLGRRQAIVEDRPGVTRDRQYAEAEHGGRHFRVVDTGGFTPTSTEQLVKAVREQALRAIDEADCVVLVVDARAGLTGPDLELAQLLRRGGKPVLVAANKVDAAVREADLDLGELHALGLEVFLLSAEHGRGVDELLDEAVKQLKTAPAAPREEKRRGGSRRKNARDARAAEEAEEGGAAGAPGADEAEDAVEPGDPEPDFALPDPSEPIRLAVLGRPNVGKSTLLNRLLGEERFVASAMPGTTRDAVDETLERDGRTFVLTDTAGLRKKRQVVDKVEIFSAQRAMRAVEESDVVVVLTDASELGVEQDARIAAQAEERGRAVILCVNKWDLVKDKETEAARLRAEAKRHLQHVGYAPLLFVSALQGTRVDAILQLAAQLHDEASRRLRTSELNAWLQDSQDQHPAPLWNGFPVRFFYAYQVAVQPPTIAIQTNRPAAVDEGYKRFLLHGLRERFGLRVPVRLLFKMKSRSQPRGAGGRA